MVVSVYRAAAGNQQNTMGVISGVDTQCPYMSLTSPKSLSVKNLAKMPQGICMLLAVFTCTFFWPKPFTVTGFIHGTVCMPISTPFKNPLLLKPFNYAHLVVSQFGMRHPKAVSHFVSFLGSNVMGMWAVAHSQTGNMRHLIWVSQTVSFCTGLFSGGSPCQCCAFYRPITVTAVHSN